MLCIFRIAESLSENLQSKAMACLLKDVPILSRIIFANIELASFRLFNGYPRFIEVQVPYSNDALHIIINVKKTRNFSGQKMFSLAWIKSHCNFNCIRKLNQNSIREFANEESNLHMVYKYGIHKSVVIIQPGAVHTVRYHL